MDHAAARAPRLSSNRTNRALVVIELAVRARTDKPVPSQERSPLARPARTAGHAINPTSPPTSTLYIYKCRSAITSTQPRSHRSPTHRPRASSWRPTPPTQDRVLSVPCSWLNPAPPQKNLTHATRVLFACDATHLGQCSQSTLFLA